MNILYSRYILNKYFQKCNIGGLIHCKIYNELCKKIVNKKLIVNITQFLNFLFKNYNRYTISNSNINKIDYKYSKKVLILFLIVNNQSYVFTNNTEYNEPLIELSNKIYTLLNKINDLSNHNWELNIMYFIKLIDLLNDFITKYNIWSMLDKRINTYILLQMNYKNTVRLLDLPKESRLYTTLKQSIENDQTELFKSVLFMKDNNEINFFNYHKDKLEYNSIINENLYFIDVKYKLCNKNPDMSIFVDLVEKTKKYLKNCVPNRDDHHNELDELLDTELMTTYIKNDILDNSYFYNIINIIINKVKEYQSAYQDETLEIFRNKCDEKLSSHELYKTFIPMFFMEIFKRLKTIGREKTEFFRFMKNV
jgi:hypothetical protein